jgi:hypothetical protein
VVGGATELSVIGLKALYRLAVECNHGCGIVRFGLPSNIQHSVALILYLLDDGGNKTGDSSK